jgi:hypothetical protein
MLATLASCGQIVYFSIDDADKINRFALLVAARAASPERRRLPASRTSFEEDRKATVSVFDGPEPTVLRYPSSVSTSSNSFTVHSFAGCLTSRD